MTNDEFNEALETLSQTREAQQLRQALDKALYDFWTYFSERGLTPNLKILVTEPSITKRQLN